MKNTSISLDLIDQVQVTRSFSRKVQIVQYEPIDIFASYTAVLKKGVSDQDIKKVSNELNELSIKAVESDIEKYYVTHVKPF